MTNPMNNPKPLSPSAQAVLDAYASRNRVKHYPYGRWSAIAAALRAAADQVVPDDPCGYDCCITTCERIRRDILAIAAELEEAQP